jgi:hypothetical protein
VNSAVCNLKLIFCIAIGYRVFALIFGSLSCPLYLLGFGQQFIHRHGTVNRKRKQTKNKNETKKEKCKVISSSNEQSPSLKANISFAIPNISCSLWNKLFITVIKQPTICPYPEPVGSNPQPPIKILQVLYFITYPSTPRSHKRLLSFRFPCQNVSTCFSSISSVLLPPFLSSLI